MGLAAGREQDQPPSATFRLTQEQANASSARTKQAGVAAAEFGASSRAPSAFPSPNPSPPPAPSPRTCTTPSRMDIFIFTEFKKESSVRVPCQAGSTPKANGVPGVCSGSMVCACAWVWVCACCCCKWWWGGGGRGGREDGSSQGGHAGQGPACSGERGVPQVRQGGMMTRQ